MSSVFLEYLWYLEYCLQYSGTWWVVKYSRLLMPRVILSQSLTANGFPPTSLQGIFDQARAEPNEKIWREADVWIDGQICFQLFFKISIVLRREKQTISRQQRQQLTLEMASSACDDSLISACVGLPSYQESFAVDPNEILSKDRATRVSINNHKFT